METTGLAVVQNENIMPALSPQEQVDKASVMGKVLQSVVRQQHLYRRFGGEKEHLYFEAWQTIAQFFNCTPVTEWILSPSRTATRLWGTRPG